MIELKNKTTLAEDICEYLRNAIFNNQIKPGEQLNELKIIEELGVSRSPVREAICVLEGEGLIERIPRRGAFVKKTTKKKIQEIFRIRAVLESMAAEEAALQFSKADLKSLENIFERMRKAAHGNNAKLYVKINYEFHKKFIKLANNKTLEELLKNLGKQSNWFMFTAFSIRHSTEVSLKEHFKILEAFVERGPDLAAKAVQKHIVEGGKRVLEVLRDVI